MVDIHVPSRDELLRQASGLEDEIARRLEIRVAKSDTWQAVLGRNWPPDPA